MNYTVSIGELMLFIMFFLAVGVAVFLIITLININKLVKRAGTIIDLNSENIHKTLSILPETMQNVNDVAVSVKSSMDKVGTVIETVEEAVTDTVVTVSESTENIADFMSTFNSIFKVIFNFFRSKK